MIDLGVSAVIELPPAGTLTGIARRALTGVETLALKTPDNLDAARALVAAHTATVGEYEPEWRLLVAPLAGTFQAGAHQPGGSIEPGTELGRVAARREAHPVTCSYGASIVEWLVADGDPVSAGQPVVRLQPEVVPA